MVVKNGTLTLKSGIKCNSIGFKNVKISGNVTLMEVYKEDIKERPNILQCINYFAYDKDTKTLYELTFEKVLSVNYEDDFISVLSYSV